MSKFETELSLLRQRKATSLRAIGRGSLIEDKATVGRWKWAIECRARAGEIVPCMSNGASGVLASIRSARGWHRTKPLRRRWITSWVRRWWRWSSSWTNVGLAARATECRSSGRAVPTVWTTAIVYRMDCVIDAHCLQRQLGRMIMHALTPICLSGQLNYAIHRRPDRFLST